MADATDRESLLAKDIRAALDEKLRARGVSDASAREDLVQSKLLYFHKRWGNFSAMSAEVRNLDALLERTAANLAVDHFRRTKRAPLLVDPQHDPHAVLCAATDDAEVDDKEKQHELAETVRELLPQLGEKDRWILEKTYWEEKSIGTMALEEMISDLISEWGLSEDDPLCTELMRIVRESADANSPQRLEQLSAVWNKERELRLHPSLPEIDFESRHKDVRDRLDQRLKRARDRLRQLLKRHQMDVG